MNTFVRSQSFFSRQAGSKDKGSVELVFAIVSDLEESAVRLGDVSCSLLRVFLDEKGSEIKAAFRVDVALGQVAFRSSRWSESLLGQEDISRSLTDSGELAGSL